MVPANMDNERYSFPVPTSGFPLCYWQKIQDFPGTREKFSWIFSEPANV